MGASLKSDIAFAIIYIQTLRKLAELSSVKRCVFCFVCNTKYCHGIPVTDRKVSDGVAVEESFLNCGSPGDQGLNFKTETMGN